MTTTTRRHYDTLNWRQKQHIREYIRITWIEDAIAELRQYPDDDALAEQLRALATNSDTAWDLINDQLEDTNPMYIEACGVVLGVDPTKDADEDEEQEPERMSIPSRYWEPGAEENPDNEEPWMDDAPLPFGDPDEDIEF